MKKFYLLLIVIFIQTTLLAQTPQKFSYQAVVRDQNSNLVTNQKIGVKISVLQSSIQGTSVYEETFNVLSNENGLISIEIGTGKPIVGTFNSIDWSKGSYFVKNEIDPKGGENYTLVSTNQLISVPYAMHAKTAESVVGFSTSGKLPIVSTDKVEEIIQDAPNLNRYLKITHTVSDDGGETVLKRGFCISESPNPTTAGKTFTNNFSSSIGQVVDSIFEVKSNQKYYVRAYAVNTKGTAYGNEIIINTIDVKVPTVSTVSVTDISYREATLTGNVLNNGNQKPRIGFCVGTKAGLTLLNSDFVYYCDTLTNFSKKISYLNHSTTYYVRAFAENSTGVAYGNELNFSTLKILKPNIQTLSVDSVSYVYASFSGKIINDGGENISNSGMCIGTTNTPTVNDIFVPNNSNNPSLIQAVTDYLSPNVTYYVRAYAKNSAGESYGNAIKFSTLNIDVITNEVKDISLFDAKFFGEVKHQGDLNNFETGFCYSQHTNPTSSDMSIPNWYDINNFSATPNDLNNNTTYYVKAYVRINGNYVYGNEISFKTKSVTITTNPVSTIRGVKAKLEGISSDSTLSQNYNLGFCYSLSPNPTTSDLVANIWYNSSPKFNTEISSLKQNTLYYVRSFIKNNYNQIIYGNQVSFTSGTIKLPTILTDSITGIRLHSATLHSTIVDDGGDDITENGYCIATHSTPTTKDLTISSYENYLSNLNINTKYYVRAYAKNSLGLTYGNEMTFTTVDLKIETSSISKVTFASAEIKAKVKARPKEIDTWDSRIYLLISKKSNPTFLINDVILNGSDWSYSDSIVKSYAQFDPASTYYVRAAVVYNSSDTAFGNILTFTTQAAPTVQTFTPTKITSNSANFTGNNANSNGYLFTQRGFYISTKPNISYTNIENSASDYSSGIGDFNATTSLQPNTTYYVKAYASTSNGLVVFGNELSFKTLPVGQKGTGGGIVFYDKGEVTDGWRYLEIASNDQSSGVIWGCENTNVYSQSQSLGGGFENTNNIVSACNDQTSAAKICYNLVSGGKTDWYLPNIQELTMAYSNILNQGNFNQVYYWSSDSYGTTAKLFGFSAGDTQDYDTKFTGSVRAVRRY